MLKKLFSSKNAKLYTILIAGAVVICMLVILFTAIASDSSRLVFGENQDGTYYVKDIKSLYRGGIFLKEKLVVPSEYKGEKVVSIEKIESNHIIELVIEDGIEEIKTGAFTGMEGLKKITIPDSVTYIGGNTFSNCHSLEEVVFPNHIKYIENLTFNGCKELKRFTLPTSCELIGDNAFSNCPSLEEVVLNDSVKTIGKEAFKDCTLLSKLNIPTTVTKVGESAFLNCVSLEELTFSNGLETIAKNTFSGMKNLKKVTLPNSVKIIEENAFYDCENLSEINLPSNLEEIGENAFANCKEIQSLTISNNIKVIDNNAFFGAIKLETINVNLANVEVGYNVFEGTKFAENAYKANDGFLVIDGVLYDFSSEEYKESKNVETIDNLIIPVIVSTINTGAFYDAVDFKAVTIPVTVLKIGKEAFSVSSKINSSYEKLKVVYFTGAVEVGKDAFKGNKELKAKVFVTELTEALVVADESNSVLEKARSVYGALGVYYTNVYLTKDDEKNKVTSQLSYDVGKCEIYRMNDGVKEIFNEKTYTFEAE